MKRAWIVWALTAGCALGPRIVSAQTATVADSSSAAATGQSGGATATTTAPPTSCVTCHTALGGELAGPLEHWQADVHAAAGLSCNDCHGGDPSPSVADDPEAAMSPKKGFVGKPSRLAIPQFCARCHADASYMKRFNPSLRVDQLVEYRTSVHGKRNAAGDPVPATCIDCHGVHGIRPVQSPDSPVFATNVPETCAHCHANAALMAPYGIPTNQYAEYRTSVHATALFDMQDLSAPACNDCHGNHGAVPPGVNSVANVCGQCHGREAMLFDASFKKELFESMDVAECLACHEHHGVRHPTPELFHSGSAPQVSQGTVTGTAPLTADLGDLEAGGQATVTWRTVLAPHLAADDKRYVHAVKVQAAGHETVTLDASVRPGDLEWAAPRRFTGADLVATLHASFPSSTPVQPGDAVVLQLDLQAVAAPLRAVRVFDAPGGGLHTVAGSVCLRCHTVGDSCDVATGKMFTAVAELDHNLRDVAALLHRAETKGMEVSGAQFDLRSKGTTAAVESRALIHSFDPQRMLKRTQEGEDEVRAAREAGNAAMAELQFRRRGLGVSLILVVMVLVGLGFKIRQVERDRNHAPST